MNMQQAHDVHSICQQLLGMSAVSSNIWASKWSKQPKRHVQLISCDRPGLSLAVTPSRVEFDVVVPV